MTTLTVRRLYVYTAAFIGLQMLAAGARGLLGALLESLMTAPGIGPSDADGQRISLNLALLVVGLALWATHWRWAQRSIGLPAERESALRRLYGYLVLAVAMLGLLPAAITILMILLGARSSGFERELAGAIAAMIVNGALWLYHWRVLRADRPMVERSGATATLRRWYLMIIQGVSLAVMTVAAISLLGRLLQAAIRPALGMDVGITEPLAALIAGLLIWTSHHLWARQLVRHSSPLRDDEARSTLRQVYAALVITATAIAALGGLASLLYGALLAALGGATWRALLEEYTTSCATVVVAVPLWWYHRAQLEEEARLSMLPARGATARRINGYLTAAIGLAALYFGLGGLCSTLLRILLAPAALGRGWQEPLSFNLALTLVALPVYAIVATGLERWTRRAPEEERTLARRMYLYAALLFGLIAAIVALVALVRLILDALLGVTPADFGAQLGRWLGYAVVGAAIAAVHARWIRRAGAPRADAGRGLTLAIVAEAPLREIVATAVQRELPAADVKALEPADVRLSDVVAHADVVIASLGAALNSPLAGTIRAFAGRRLLLAAATPDIELLGATQSPDALARAVTHRLRELNTKPPTTAPPQPALPAKNA